MYNGRKKLQKRKSVKGVEKCLVTENTIRVISDHKIHKNISEIQTILFIVVGGNLNL
jgi:hypothetical protein